MSRVRYACLLLVAAWLGAGCAHTLSVKEQQKAQIHYDLGIHAQENGDKQAAYTELKTALEIDPNFAEAHFAMGLLLQFGSQRIEEAAEHYRKALELRPTYSEVKTNLGTIYMTQGRYDDAIPLFEQALNDMAYGTPYIAQGNLGMAYYRKGDTPRAIDSIKSAVTANPKFCVGYKWLGEIYKEKGDGDAACRQYAFYRENCPDVPDAYLQEGICLAGRGERDLAFERFSVCEDKSPPGEMREDCRKFKGELQQK